MRTVARGRIIALGNTLEEQPPLVAELRLAISAVRQAMARLYSCVPYDRRAAFDKMRTDYERALAGQPPTDRGDGVPEWWAIERTLHARDHAARMSNEAEYWARRALERARPSHGADWLTVRLNASYLVEAIARLDTALADCEAAVRLMS